MYKRQAYGRGAQAEEILKDAIQKEPKRYELHLKLLEIYAESKNNSAFEAIAGELYTTLGADDPTWAKVARLGATLEPDNPLYDVSKLAVASVATSLALDGTDEEIDFGDVGVSEPEAASDNGLDFSLDNDNPFATEDANSVVADSFTAPQNVDQFDADMESFDIGSADVNTLDDAAVEGATLATVEADNSMDFDLGEQFDSESVVATSADNAALDVSESLPAFDLPIQASEDFAVPPLDLPAEIEVPTPASGLAEVSNLAETSSPTLDFAMDLDFPTESTVTEEVVSGLDQKVAEPLEDFSFDLPVTDTDSLSLIHI